MPTFKLRLFQIYTYYLAMSNTPCTRQLADNNYKDWSRTIGGYSSFSGLGSDWMLQLLPSARKNEASFLSAHFASSFVKRESLFIEKKASLHTSI